MLSMKNKQLVFLTLFFYKLNIKKGLKEKEYQDFIIINRDIFEENPQEKLENKQFFNDYLSKIRQSHKGSFSNNDSMKTSAILLEKNTIFEQFFTSKTRKKNIIIEKTMFYS